MTWLYLKKWKKIFAHYVMCCYCCCPRSPRSSFLFMNWPHPKFTTIHHPSPRRHTKFTRGWIQSEYRRHPLNLNLFSRESLSRAAIDSCVCIVNDRSPDGWRGSTFILIFSPAPTPANVHVQFLFKKKLFYFIILFIQNNSTSRSADRFAYMNINFFFQLCL